MLYIGATTRPLRTRWKQHFWKSNPRKTAIREAILKHGKDAFDISILSECQSLEQMHDAEEYFIDYYNSVYPNGYNLESGGKKKKHHAETKRKMSIAALGEKNHNFGKKASEESRKKLSLSLTGRIFSEEYRKKLGEAMRKRHERRRIESK